VEPENWGVEGRGNIRDYDRLGYVPVDANYSHGRQDITHRTVSRSIEYAHNDFSIAMFARKSGDREIYEKYITRASNWENLWMKEAVEPTTGLTGFFQGKYSNGSWAIHSREGCTTCTVGHAGPDGEFYEESAWSYSWFVPHDYAKLIELVGGRDSFVKRLGDYLLITSLMTDVFFDMGFANVGNEPGLLQAVLYHYAVSDMLEIAYCRDNLRNLWGERVN
jgi:putative alpha-1,2-mannosidase